MSQPKEGEIPNLQIVPAESIVLHEEVDRRRVTPLVEKLSHDGILKNPPIVAPLPDNHRYVVLDGANRTTALWEIKAPHHLVQVVGYDEVKLATWGHLIVAGLTEQQFESRRLERGLELTYTDLATAHRQLRARQVSAILSSPAGEICTLGHGGDLRAEAADLRTLVSIYSGLSTIHRVNAPSLAELLPYYDDVVAMIHFPCYTPADILTLANDGDKLPTGITRHVISRRALRVNLPISLLMDEECTTEQKNAWLAAWLKEKLARRQIRYYQESTFLFDE
jgi:hypothetical protein